jgi:hypothetical protein
MQDDLDEASDPAAPLIGTAGWPIPKAAQGAFPEGKSHLGTVSRMQTRLHMMELSL